MKEQKLSNDNAIFKIVDEIRASSKVMAEVPKDIGSNVKDVIKNDMKKVIGSEMSKMASIVDFSSIKDIGSNIKSTIASDISGVLGPEMMKVIGVFAPLGNVFKNMKENWSARKQSKTEESFDTDLMDDTNKGMKDLAEAGLKKGSIYTHDLSAEKALDGLTQSISVSNKNAVNMADNIVGEVQKMSELQ